MKNVTNLSIKVFSLLGFFILIGCSTTPQPSNSTITPQDIEQLPIAAKCGTALDDEKRTYTIEMSNLDPDEKIRFLTRGWASKNQLYTASELLNNPVKLPAMSIQSRRGGDNQGLWVERISTGERQQLNRLTPNFNCNSKGITIVEYINIWVSLTQ